MKKKILFLAHSFCDVDWFLPVISALKESGEFEPVLFFLRSEKEMGMSEAHLNMIEELSVRSDCLYDISGLGLLTRILVKLLRYCAKGATLTPFGDMVKDIAFGKIALKLIYVCVERLFGKFPGFLFPEEKIRSFIRKKRVSALIVDKQRIKRSPPYFKDLRSYATSIIALFCKADSVPILMVPHGISYCLDVGKKDTCQLNTRCHEISSYGRDKTLVYPDVYVGEYEGAWKKHSELIGKETSLIDGGGVKCDFFWNNKIQQLARTFTPDIKKKKFTILYFVSPFGSKGFDGPLAVDESIDNDVLSIVEGFPDVELWIKYHPRYPKGSKVFGVVKSSVNGRIKKFGNKVDSNALMSYADLVISPGSSMLPQSLVSGKATIAHELWRERLNFTGRTIYDGFSCVLKASNRGELHDQCRKVINGWRPPEAEIERFYKERISIGLEKGESIPARYVNIIRKFLR